MTRALRLSLSAVVLAAVVAGLVIQSRLAPETHPWGDTATTSIYAMRAARGELATGAYSRFEWNHPGPLLYQLLAPLYRLSGYREISLKWTVLLINLVALAGLLAVVARRAPPLAVAVAIALVPLIYREQRLLFWAWNPIVPLIPLALALALAAAMASEGLTLLPVFVAVASFIVQTHVGFVPVLGAVTLVVLVHSVGSGRSRMTRVRSLWLAALVFTALWAVPVIHDLRHPPGNLVALARFFLSGSSEPHDWRSVLVISANQLIGPFDPRWELTTFGASAAVSWPVLLAAAAEIPLLVLTAVAALRQHRRFEAAFAWTALAATLSGILAVRAIAGPISDYLVIWLAVIGALNLAAIAAPLLRAIQVGRSLGPVAVRAVLTVYVALVGGLGANRLIGKQAADARSIIVPTLSGELARYCASERIARPVLGFSWEAWQVATGIVLDFYTDERPIAVTNDVRFVVGEPFAVTGTESAEFYLMPQDEGLPAGATRHVWLATFGSFRLVRLFRD